MDTSVKDLKKAISKSRYKDKAKHSEVIQKITSLLAANPSDGKKKLAKFFRQPLVPIFSTYLLPALHFASALFHCIYHEKVLTALGKQLLEEKREWEDVLTSLLSGVLDLLDEYKNKSSAAKNAIASALYPTLCDICFSLSAPMQSVDLRCTAYTLLSDSAASHTHNQQKLRDKSVLGGERLGSMIWRTKDYLALESLLTLFARILPSAKDSPSGHVKRAAYIKSVFLSPQQSEHSSVGQTIAKLLERVPTNEWEDTSREIVDVLAAAYVAFPQPFSVDKVNACDETKQCDKLFVDQKAFLVNVLIGDDQCEALEIAYNTISKIEVTPGQAAGATVEVRVKTPPAIGKVPVKSTQASPHRVGFALANGDVERFYSAVRSRGLGRLLKDVPHKLSLARSPAVLDFDGQGRPVKELSQSERIENVEKFYHTNQSSDDLSVASPRIGVQDQVAAALKVISVPKDIRTADLAIKLDESSNKKPTTPSTTTLEHPVQSTVSVAKSNKTRSNQKAASDATDIAPTQVSTSTAGKLAKPLGRTRSKKMRDDIFGASDEELSEASDADDVPLVSKVSQLAKATKSNNNSNGRKVSSLVVTPAVRLGAARRVLDSDDEEVGHRGSAGSMATAPRRTGNKTRAILPSPDCSDAEPIDNRFVTPPRSQLEPTAAPVTPTKPPASRPLPPQEPSSPDIATLDSLSSDAGKTLPMVEQNVANGLGSASLAAARLTSAIGEDPAPSPVRPATAKASRKPRALVNKEATVPSARNGVLTERTPNTDGTRPASKATDAKKISGKVVPLPMNLELSDHIMNSSSPVPIVKLEKTSVKAKLRKKAQPLVEDKKAAHVKTSKRKRAVLDEDHDPPDAASAHDDAGPPPKKSRGDGGDTEQGSTLRKRRTDSHVLRPNITAASRTTQRYRAKKDKASSPPSNRDAFDYDELPGSVAASDVRSHSSPTQVARRSKKENGKSKVADAPARRTRTTRATAKEDQSHVSDTVVPGSEPGRVSTNDVPVGADDLQDEEEVTNLLTKPSKPSVTVVERPVVEAMKASAISSAAANNPFVEPLTNAAHATQVTDGAGGKRKAGSASGKKSNKMPWLAVTKQVVDDGNAEQAIPHESDEGRFDAADASAERQSKTTGQRQARTSEADKVVTRIHSTYHPVCLTTLTQVNGNDKAAVDHKTSTASREQRSITAPRVETIDLTHDDTPDKRREVPPTPNRQPSPALQLDLEDTLVDPPQSSASTPYRKSGAVKCTGSTMKTTRCVTFTPSVEQKLSSPSPLAREALANAKLAASTNHMLRSNEVDKHKVKPKKMPSYIELEAKKSKVMNSPGLKSSTSGKKSQLEDVVDVLGELQQAILHRITQRFEGVREEVRFGRNTLLSEATEDLLHMRNRSITHFNHLIDLEAEYAKLGRRLVNGYEQLSQEGQEICSGTTRMVADHDRGSLIPRMPVDLAALPACFRSNNG
ncbi:hypothetical protein EVJ58_g3922 [Rhodofomes roseus]|uniref:Uncharacterized protein n=1 Tax=Rhodofomes roseus TaxID=34475 RepID=A0A4Y9YL61_9APHY|nr:hypothetical protein EVJ58_g3922 [Rhodofomes roseus]